MSTTEQTSRRTMNVAISLDRDVTLDEYARILVAISQIPGVESIGGDPVADLMAEQA